MNQQKEHEKITVYSPESGIRHPLRLVRDMFRDLKQANELGVRLTKRNIKAMYRQSLLGYVWSVLPPLITALLWVFLNSQGVVKVAAPGIPYPLFVIIGTMLWQVFMESVNAPMKGITSGRSMLAKINFPRESLILTGMYEVVFNLMIKLGLILIVFIYYGLTPSFSALASLLGFLVMVVLGSSFGLILVPIGMLYTDIQRGIGLVLRFGMYLTPVIYPMPKSGLAAKLMAFNPVAPVLTYTRELLVGTATSVNMSFVAISIGAVLLFFFGLFLYRLSMPIIIERIGS